MLSTHDKDLKCLILCAGLGTRLKPLTLNRPKPLATILNVPLFDIALSACLKTGTDQIAVNTHHLHELMAEHARRAALNLGLRRLHISHEHPEILGTGGALSQLAPWWGNSDLLVYNGDILSDMPLNELVSRHRNSGNLVTLAVRRDIPIQAGRSVWLDALGQVKSIARRSDLPPEILNQGLDECGFACAYVVSPNFRQYIPQSPAFFDVVEGFNRAIADGQRIGGVLFSGLWADIGTPRALWEANLAVRVLSEPKLDQLLGPSSRLISKVPPDCKIDHESVVSPSAIIGSGAIIVKSVLLEGATVQPGEKLYQCLRGQGFDATYEL